MKKKILYICGSINQTTQMHKIASQLAEFDSYFTPFYASGILKTLSRLNFLDFSLLGGQFRQNTIKYLSENKLNIDFNGENNDYDLVFTCSDLIIPENIRKKRVILIQEGMTDPENLMYYLVKYLKLPRYLASTSTTGMSDVYTKFCVASEGYKELFIKKGVNPEKIEVTGIPNFDNCKQFLKNDFPHKNFILVATSDARETFKYENRKKFIREVDLLRKNKKVIFKLHPNENHIRAKQEIKEIIPDAIVLTSGKIEPMIANCDMLITKYSSVVYVGLALGKEVKSYFDEELLKKLLPIQNNGNSALNIAEITRKLLRNKSMVVENFESQSLFNGIKNSIKNSKTSFGKI